MIKLFFFFFWLHKNSSAPRFESATTPLEVLRHELGEVHDPLAVAPLVVVPRHHLDHVVAHHHGEGRVNGGGLVRGPEVGGHERLVGDREDALEVGVRGLPQHGVDLLGEGLLLDLDDEVHDGHVRGRDAEGDPGELALQAWHHEGDGLGGPGGRGHDVQGGGPGPPEVPVGRVEEPLVPGVRVRRGHGPLDDPEALVQDLHEGGEAVGGARGVRHDRGAPVVVPLVDSNDVGRDGLVLGGGGDDDLLRSRGEVLPGPDGVQEHPGSFDHHVDPHVLPRELERVAAGHDLDGPAVEREGGVVQDLNIRVEGPQDRVVLEEVGRLLHPTTVVHRDDLQVRVLPPLEAPQEVTSNPSETVDGHLHLHPRAPPARHRRPRARSSRTPQHPVLRYSNHPHKQTQTQTQTHSRSSSSSSSSWW
mmetsp:Transcript_4949/g.14807  ORF Transcript_4949/g.14807 Transcript_4949/m.14807 type:complete len:418 (-) Transcript_4949:14-1267(-)